MKDNHVSIIGFGRFGQVLAGILKDDFSVQVFDTSDKSKEAKKIGVKFVELTEALNSSTIFYAIPINRFTEIIEKHASLLQKQQEEKLLIDVLSVKSYPKNVFQKFLPKNCHALLTHPLFGPDSLKVNGLPGLRIVMDQFTSRKADYAFWKKYFSNKGLQVIEMSAEKHDQLASYSQGIAFFIAKMLGELHLDYSSIDTLWAQKLIEITKALNNDSWELFVDLQTKNPYTKEMRIKVGEAFDKTYNKLLPQRIKPGELVLGIQGGKGSFNEEAANYFTKRADVHTEIKYLYTTENVLKALYEGEIDRGQFAIFNSLGGVVDESIEAMAHYKFKIVEKFAIKISHALMIRKDSSYDEIDTIMTHPQVLKQCQKNLAEKYSHLKQTSGEGELIDHAKVAELLSLGKLPKNIAVMGSKILAEIYGLKIVEDNLQDLAENYTTFLQAERL